MKQMSKVEERLLSLVKEERALREKKFTELVNNFTNWISVTVKNSLQYEVQSTLIKGIEDTIRENPYNDKYIIESTKLVRIPECYKNIFKSRLYDELGKDKVNQTFDILYSEIYGNSGTVCELPETVVMCEELNYKIGMRLVIDVKEETDEQEEQMGNQYAMAN